MRAKHALRIVSLVTVMLTGNLLASQTESPNLSERRKALNDLLAEQWEYVLSTNPEFASVIGDKRWNNKISAASVESIRADLAKTREFLTRFEAINTVGFPEQEALNKTLMVRGLREQVENARFKHWEMPVNQMGGVHIDTPELVSLLQFVTAKDYEDYIARMKQLPRLFNEISDNMRSGIKSGLMPPRFLLEKVLTQTENIAKQEPDKSPFARPLNDFPKEIPPAEQERTPSL
jgi:uncharacterized protein (DUF885 family)